MTVVEVTVQQPVYVCVECGVRTVNVDALLDRDLHHNYDDDCPVGWDRNHETVHFRQVGPVETKLADRTGAV